MLLQEALHLCEESDGPYLYAEAVEADLEMIRSVETAKTFVEFYEKIRSIGWKRLSAKKDDTIDPVKKERVKTLREKAKKLVKDLQESCFYETPKKLAERSAKHGRYHGRTGRIGTQIRTVVCRKKEKQKCNRFSGYGAVCTSDPDRRSRGTISAVSGRPGVSGAV